MIIPVDSHGSFHVRRLIRLVNLISSFINLYPHLTIPTRPIYHLSPHLFNSSALFFNSSFDAFSGMLSACTGPCLPVSLHPVYCTLSSRDGVLRTGAALCWAMLALLLSSSKWCVSGGGVV